MLVTQSVMGLVALTLGLLTLSGRIQLWHIYALLAVNATAFAFDLPARYSLTPNLVPKKVLANALGVEVIAFHIGSLAGPLLNGWLINFFWAAGGLPSFGWILCSCACAAYSYWAGTARKTRNYSARHGLESD